MKYFGFGLKNKLYISKGDNHMGISGALVCFVPRFKQMAGPRTSVPGIF